MCISLKLEYANFGVSKLFCSKVIEQKPLGCRLDPPSPLVKQGLNVTVDVLMLTITSLEKTEL